MKVGQEVALYPSPTGKIMPPLPSSLSPSLPPSSIPSHTQPLCYLMHTSMVELNPTLENSSLLSRAQASEWNVLDQETPTGRLPMVHGSQQTHKTHFTRSQIPAGAYKPYISQVSLTTQLMYTHVWRTSLEPWFNELSSSPAVSSFSHTTPETLDSYVSMALHHVATKIAITVKVCKFIQ